MIKVLILGNYKFTPASCLINDESVRVLHSLNWPELTHLDLSIVELDVDGNNLTKKGIIKLVNKEWPKLSFINLSNKEIY